MKWLLILFVGIIVIPTFAQNTLINQTDYQKLETSINRLNVKLQQLNTSINVLQIEQQQLNISVNGLHTDHIQSDSSTRNLTVVTFVGSGLIAIVFFLVHSIQSRKIEGMASEIKGVVTKQDKLIEDVHVFAEEQNVIKEKKRLKHALGILSTLQLIDFEVEGLFIFTKFLQNATSLFDKNEKKKTLLHNYERIQFLFMNMKIEFDTMLEIFNSQVEEQYTKVYQTVFSHKDIWQYNLENIDTLKREIEKIRNEFKIFKDLLLPFLPSGSRSRFEKLFDLETIQNTISQIPSSQGNNQQGSESRS